MSDRPAHAPVIYVHTSRTDDSPAPASQTDAIARIADQLNTQGAPLTGEPSS
jgi:hypothetical protein